MLAFFGKFISRELFCGVVVEFLRGVFGGFSGYTRRYLSWYLRKGFFKTGFFERVFPNEFLRMDFPYRFFRTGFSERVFRSEFFRTGFYERVFPEVDADRRVLFSFFDASDGRRRRIL